MYDKTCHIFPVSAKKNLDNNQLKHLLTGEMIVEEKMDGANVGIIRHKKGFALQRRGGLVGESEHEQFSFFNNWAHQQNYDKIMSLPIGVLLYGELLYAVHTLRYDKLPDFVLIFDVKQNGRWLNYDDRKKLCDDHKFKMVPLLGRGTYTKLDLIKMVPKASAYGPVAEGIVVKRYAKHGYFRGKIVKSEFIKAMEESEHWNTKPIEKNRLSS